MCELKLCNLKDSFLICWLVSWNIWQIFSHLMLHWQGTWYHHVESWFLGKAANGKFCKIFGSFIASTDWWDDGQLIQMMCTDCQSIHGISCLWFWIILHKFRQFFSQYSRPFLKAFKISRWLLSPCTKISNLADLSILCHPIISCRAIWWKSMPHLHLLSLGIWKLLVQLMIATQFYIFICRFAKCTFSLFNLGRRAISNYAMELWS